MRKIVVGIFVACLILSALYYQPVRAADFYVNVNTGNDNVSCGTQASPCKTIKYTVDSKAAPDDTIHVAAGTYNYPNGERFPILIKKNLTLIGAGVGNSIIEAKALLGQGGPWTAIQVQNSVVNIRGFEIWNAGNAGVTYFNGASGIITENSIHDNDKEGIRVSASLPGGGGGNPSHPTITYNDIYNNGIGGIHTLQGSNPQITNNFITGNRNHGIYVENSNPIINGNLIAGNDRDGIYLSHSSSSPIITNNTIIYNFDDNIDNEYGGNPTIANNIIAFAIDDEGIQWWYEEAMAPTGQSDSEGNDDEKDEADEIEPKRLIAFDNGEYNIFNNDVYGNDCDNYMDMPDLTGIDGNISEDPLFTGDFHLYCDSPAINAGDNQAPDIPKFDLDGNQRIQDSIIDMGAYEGCVTRLVTRKHLQLPSLLPAAQNNLTKGGDLLKQAGDLLTQAQQKGADCTECEKLINEAKELLSKSKASLTNPIYANNLALQALEKLKQAIDCLKALLG